MYFINTESSLLLDLIFNALRTLFLAEAVSAKQQEKGWSHEELTLAIFFS